MGRNVACRPYSEAGGRDRVEPYDPVHARPEQYRPERGYSRGISDEIIGPRWWTRFTETEHLENLHPKLKIISVKPALDALTGRWPVTSASPDPLRSD